MLARWFCMRIDLPFEEWEREQLPAFTEDVMWKMVSLRVALYLLDLARLDIEAMRGAYAMDRVATQLYSAVGSIGANLTEGFSRATLPDRARFFSYALGSVRESIWWYAAARGVLEDEAYRRRLVVLARERRLLVGTLRKTHERIKDPPFRS